MGDSEILQLTKSLIVMKIAGAIHEKKLNYKGIYKPVFFRLYLSKTFVNRQGRRRTEINEI